MISNARHTVGDGDGGKARAISERTTSNARHATAYGDGGKARAITVFVSIYISANCILKGRKVIA